MQIRDCMLIKVNTEMRKLGFENYINVLESHLLNYIESDKSWSFIGVGKGEEGRWELK